MEQISENRGDYVIEHYNSLAEFADYAERRASSETKNEKPDEWRGNVSFAQALKLARNGWTEELPEALAIAERSIKTLTDMRLIPIPTPVWDVSGSEVDVARFLSDEPENMIEFPPAANKRAGQVVTIVKSFSVSGGISAAKILDHGRKLVALAMAVEKMGLSSELWIDFAAGAGPGSRRYQRVPVKSADDILDPGQIMFALAHPAMLRVVAFGNWDKGIPGNAGKVARSAGRGRPESRTKREQEFFPEGTVFTERLFLGDDPVPFLLKELRKLGLIDAE